jgi:hypothetical protein
VNDAEVSYSYVTLCNCLEREPRITYYYLLNKESIEIKMMKFSRQIFCFAAVILQVSWSLQDSSRRQLLLKGLVATETLSLVATARPADAARGAAELDFEFYMRDLVGGNKKEGNVEPSKPPTVGDPRILKGPLLPLMLDNPCSQSCIPVQALLSQIKASGSSKANDDTKILAEIQENVQSYRSKASRSFSTRAPWKQEDVSDQYYFDLTSYALWRTAADMLPNFLDRDKFARNVGKLMYQKMLSTGLLKNNNDVIAGSKNPLVDATPQSIQILELFKDCGYCKNYKIRSDESAEPNAPVFDKLDDESLLAGGSIDCLVSVYEPATLGASLQITGEQSRFGPDYVGSTLAALWESAGVKSSWETFFIDPVYRPNPKDYFPDEQLFQYTLSLK